MMCLCEENRLEIGGLLKFETEGRPKGALIGFFLNEVGMNPKYP